MFANRKPVRDISAYLSPHVYGGVRKISTKDAARDKEHIVAALADVCKKEPKGDN